MNRQMLDFISAGINNDVMTDSGNLFHDWKVWSAEAAADILPYPSHRYVIEIRSCKHGFKKCLLSHKSESNLSIHDDDNRFNCHA